MTRNTHLSLRLSIGALALACALASAAPSLAAGNMLLTGGTPVPQAFGAAQAATAASSAPACMLTRTLSRGDTDATTNGNVSSLQQVLSSRGYLDQSLVTGTFGPLTESAVMRYQIHQGIVSSGSAKSTGFGAAGPLTLSALGCNSAQPDFSNAQPPQSSAQSGPAGQSSGAPVRVVSASPLSGQIPFMVSFSGSVPGTSYTLNFGDGSPAISARDSIPCATDQPNCEQNHLMTVNQVHTYSQAGAYQATLSNTLVSWPFFIMVYAPGQGSYAGASAGSASSASTSAFGNFSAGTAAPASSALCSTTATSGAFGNCSTQPQGSSGGSNPSATGAFGAR